MSEGVLDSSAVLALILEEPGAELVEGYLPGARISAVNVGEVVAKLHDLGAPADIIEQIVAGLQIRVHAHDREASLASGHLRPDTRAAGLSLGDRACLALAKALDLPAVTADRNWPKVARRAGVRVELIR